MIVTVEVGGELREFLLYTFLESRLNAFRLLSKMEIKTNSSDYIKEAAGIYLYEYEGEKNESILNIYWKSKN